MASRKTKSVIISISLFTPYGYKFEGRINGSWNNGAIYEIYGSSNVKWATNSPWFFTVNGVNGGGGIDRLNREGHIWSSLPSANTDNAYYVTFSSLQKNISPAVYNFRLFGFSVPARQIY